MRLRTCVMLLPCWCREACCIWLVSERHTADTSELVMNNHIMCGIGVKKSVSRQHLKAPVWNRLANCSVREGAGAIDLSSKTRTATTTGFAWMATHTTRACNAAYSYLISSFYSKLSAQRGTLYKDATLQVCNRDANANANAEAHGLPIGLTKTGPQYFVATPNSELQLPIIVRRKSRVIIALSHLRAVSTIANLFGVCLSTTNFLVLGKLFHNPLSNECIIDLVSRYELGLTDWWRREYGGLDFAYGTQQKTQASNDSVLL
uniref:Uncharacterized protein n=1 Tax=Oryza rufipogon TaxID=4529 RepID=A0A0E0NMC1_ORYRU